jgi:hypothetical protein
MAFMSLDVIALATDSLLSICLKSKHRGALENASVGLYEAGIACLASKGPERAFPQVMRCFLVYYFKSVCPFLVLPIVKKE